MTQPASRRPAASRKPVSKAAASMARASKARASKTPASKTPAPKARASKAAPAPKPKPKKAPKAAPAKAPPSAQATKPAPIQAARKPRASKPAVAAVVPPAPPAPAPVLTPPAPPAAPTPAAPVPASMPSAGIPSAGMSSEELLLRIVALLRERRGEDVVALDVRGLADYMDFLVLATGRSERQNQAIADGVMRGLRGLKVRPLKRPGPEDGAWICLDFVDVVVHVFDGATRAHYDLEHLWGDAPQFPLPEATAPTVG